MNLGDVYCAYCASTLLNAASLIETKIYDRNRQLVEEKPFNERGYQAIVTLGKMKRDAEAAGHRFLLIMGQSVEESAIFACFIIGGTAVCAMHVMEAIDADRYRPKVRTY